MSDYMSYSALSDMTRCPKMFELKRLRQAPEPPAWWNVGGTAVHQWTEGFDRHFDAGREIPDEMVQDHFIALLEKQAKNQEEETEINRQEWRTAGGLRGPAQTGEWWAEKGPDFCRNYRNWRMETRWEIARVPGTDDPAIELDCLADLGGNVLLKAILDRVFVHPDGGYYLVDLKSGASTPDSNLQLAIQKIALEQNIPMFVAHGEYYNLRSDKHIHHDLTAQSGEYYRRLVKDFVRLRTTGPFLPSRGRNCFTCGMRNFCAAEGGREAHLYDPLHPAYQGDPR